MIYKSTRRGGEEDEPKEGSYVRRRMCEGEGGCGRREGFCHKYCTKLLIVAGNVLSIAKCEKAYYGIKSTLFAYSMCQRLQCDFLFEIPNWEQEEKLSS